MATTKFTIVLILIIMEDTHGGAEEQSLAMFASLNPYYNGRYSWRIPKRRWAKRFHVLILIIMEDTHGV